MLDKTKMIMFRLDKKQLINQLKALQDNYIELWVSLQDKSFITLKDSNNINRMTTKN